MLKKLGKLPAKPDAVKLKLSAFVDAAALPTPPAEFGHYGLGAGLEWGVLGNSDCGDCVWAGAAHETMLWTHRSGAGAPAPFNDAVVIAAYSDATGYTPSAPESDQGTDMTAGASYRRKTGILDAAGILHKIEAYVALRRGDVGQLALATWLFGAAGVGLQLPDYAEGQFDEGRPWDVQAGAEKGIGGHYVPCVGRNSAGHFLVVTWGRLHAMTPAFYARYSDEAMAYLTAENLRDDLSPEGFKIDELRADLARLTGERAMSDGNQSAPQGTKVDTGEIDAVFAAIKKLADDKVPGWERGMISDDLLREVAVAAVTASVTYRNAPSI